MKKKFMYLIALLVVVVGFVYLNNAAAEVDNTGKTVKVVSIESKDFIDTSIEDQGVLNVRPAHVYDIWYDESFIIDQLSVENGSLVTAGSVLVKGHTVSSIKSDEQMAKLDLEIDQVIGQLRVNRKQETDLKSKLLEDKTTLSESIAENTKLKDLNTSLYQEAIISKTVYEADEYKYKKLIETDQKTLDSLDENFQFDLNTLKEERARLQSRLALLEDERSTCESGQSIEIIASRDGVIYFNQQINSNSIINRMQVIGQLYDTSNSQNYVMDVELSEADYNKISKGASCMIQPKGVEQQVMKGVISNFKPVINSRNGINYYNLKIDIEAGYDTEHLLNNMPAKIAIESKFEFESDEETVYFLVPATSIVNREDRSVVYEFAAEEQSKEGKAVGHPVEIIFTIDANVIVKSSDFTSDTKVITEGNYDLIGGEKVLLDDGKSGGNLKIETGG